MPEAALEIVAILERFIAETPLTTRPNRGDFAWKWERRPQPLMEIYLDAFFEKCFGMYAAVKRQGLDRASKRDVDLLHDMAPSQGLAAGARNACRMASG